MTEATTGVAPPVDVINRRPCDSLSDSVIRYQGYRFALDSPRRRLEVPSGFVTLVLGFGGFLHLTDAVAPTGTERLRSPVSGLRTTGVVSEHDGHMSGIHVVLSPPAARTILAVPMTELAGRHVELAEVLGREATELTERLRSCPDWESRFGVLDRFFSRRLREGPAGSPRVAWTVEQIRRSGGGMPVEHLAGITGQSRRHMERLFGEHVGVTPKAFARIIRFQRALRLGSSGLSPARVAVGAGYHDQAHYARSFKAMVGCTPGRFHADRVPSGHPARNARIDSPVTALDPP